MPEKGKKADLMFVQHMLAVLKADGKMATIMPHGVLFRGGEEREARKHFIERGWLEAVIGLPAGLFYGTGIPACVLVMNKKGAADRKHVFFIMPTGNTVKGRRRTFCVPKTSPRSSTSIVSGKRFKVTRDLYRLRKLRPKNTTATSGAMWTMPHRLSRMTCEPTCTAACRWRKSKHWVISGPTIQVCENVCLFHDKKIRPMQTSPQPSLTVAFWPIS